MLRGVRAEWVRLGGRVVNVDFVDSLFERTNFTRLYSDGHFWGANVWSECVFRELELLNGICRTNRFEGCRFEDSRLERLLPVRRYSRTVTFRGLQLVGFEDWRTVRGYEWTVTGPSPICFRSPRFLWNAVNDILGSNRP